MLDGRGQPRGVFETMMVFEAPFHAVDAQFAADEGEGDGSFADWRSAHERYFSALLAKEGLESTDNLRVIFQRFRLVWVPAAWTASSLGRQKQVLPNTGHPEAGRPDYGSPVDGPQMPASHTRVAYISAARTSGRPAYRPAKLHTRTTYSKSAVQGCEKRISG
jgi:hypothetical protein